MHAALLYTLDMPIHDWTRVSAGTFHHFHHGWITRLSDSLNGGLLPADYYAMAEQVAGRTIPDVLTLENIAGPLSDQGFDLDPPAHATSPDDGPADPKGDPQGGSVAVLSAPPQVSVVERLSEAALLTLKRRRIAIRHASDDRIVALLEIFSPGNKEGQGPMRALLNKSVAALQSGYHLVVIDLLPPGPSNPRGNPRGLHDRLWRDLGGGGFTPPADRPLTLAAYRAADGITAYVEPTAVGRELVDLPLFFSPDRYVNVPLAATYASAFAGVPRHLRARLEGPAADGGQPAAR